MTDNQPKVREFTAVHIDESAVGFTGTHENELFFNCRFENLNGLTLKNCKLAGSEFDPKSIKDALNFTVTLDCHSFADVQLSPLVFDLILMLLLKTKGNEAKRHKLIEVLGRDRVLQLFRELQGIE